MLVVLATRRLDNTSMTKTFFSLAGVPASLLGMGAAAIIVVVAAASPRDTCGGGCGTRRGTAVHLLLYVALGLAFVHQLQETTTFTSSAVREDLLVGPVAVRVRRPDHRAGS